MVDTTAPSAAHRLHLQRSLEQRLLPRRGPTVYYKGDAAGGFTAHALPPHRRRPGVPGYTFGSLVGSACPTSAAPETFNGASPRLRRGQRHEQRGASTDPAHSYTATVDSHRPSGGALAANGVRPPAAAAPSYLTSGTSRRDRSPTPTTPTVAPVSPAPRVTLQRATLSADSCPGYGARATITGATSQPASRTATATSSRSPHRQRRQRGDFTTTVKVDTTAPSRRPPSASRR